MASNIISTAIDETYPVAGVDNDTQGFRDNFAIIKNNFTAAKSEIEDLQENSARLDEDNDFKGSNIQGANFKATTQEYFPVGNLAPLQDNVDINFENGHYHTLIIDENDITVNLTGWPPITQDNERSGLVKFVVELRGADTQGGAPRTITWTTRGGSVGTSFKTKSDFPDPFTVDSADSASEIVEFWSYNGGQTVYANYLGKYE